MWVREGGLDLQPNFLFSVPRVRIDAPVVALDRAFFFPTKVRQHVYVRQLFKRRRPWLTLRRRLAVQLQARGIRAARGAWAPAAASSIGGSASLAYRGRGARQGRTHFRSLVASRGRVRVSLSGGGFTTGPLWGIANHRHVTRSPARQAVLARRARRRARARFTPVLRAKFIRLERLARRPRLNFFGRPLPTKPRFQSRLRNPRLQKLTRR